MQHVNLDRRLGAGRWLASATGVIVALAGCTALAFALEAWLGLNDASSVYLLGVAGVAIVSGTVPAIAAALGAFVIYNFLFVDPRFSLIVGGPQELLTLLLLLGLGVLIARLAGLQRDRARQAARREREARAIFGISRVLAGGEPLDRSVGAAVERLRPEAGMHAVWVTTGAEGTARLLAGAGPTPDAAPASYALLRRDADEGRAEWTRIHEPRSPRAGRPSGEGHAYRIELMAGGERVGSLWAMRERADALQLEETRLLASAADQIGQAIRRERLGRQSLELEVTRRSDELKTALLVSVSHDLRTPLSAIRAAAGNLADPAVQLEDGDRRQLAAAIDDEAARLNRLVGNLLDMSRVEGRDLAPNLAPIPLADAVEAAVERMRPVVGRREIHIAIPGDLPPVRADPTLLDQVLGNLLDNLAKHTTEGTPARIDAVRDGDAIVLDVEDGGAGVPDEALARLFERFYRVAGKHGARGTGLGLAVVKGFVEAMGGTAWAAHGRDGGLAVFIRLPADAPRAAAQ